MCQARLSVKTDGVCDAKCPVFVAKLTFYQYIFDLYTTVFHNYFESTGFDVLTFYSEVTLIF